MNLEGLTRGEIERMGAGYEMDRLIAEHLFGYTTVEDWRMRKLVQQKSESPVPYQNSSGSVVLTPRYSTEIAAAYHALEAMIERGWSSAAIYVGDKGGSAGVSLRPTYEIVRPYMPPNERLKSFEVEATAWAEGDDKYPSMPLAACRAILLGLSGAVWREWVE